jgi:exonuclease V
MVGDSDNDDTEDSKIIGTREFYYDEDFLNTQVSDILQWWYGKRKPNGVPIHLSRRCLCVSRFLTLSLSDFISCSSCEYNSDCEWREEKAIEYTRSMAQRKSNI